MRSRARLRGYIRQLQHEHIGYRVASSLLKSTLSIGGSAFPCHVGEKLGRLSLENAGRLDGKNRGAQVALESLDAVAEDAPAAEGRRVEIPEHRLDSPFDIEGFRVAGEIFETRSRDVCFVAFREQRRTRPPPCHRPTTDTRLHHLPLR